jgi:hypothetical protein
MSNDVTDFEGAAGPELRLALHPLSDLFPIVVRKKRVAAR